MTIQTAGNVLVAIKRETVTGTAATASGAQQMRIVDSPGLDLKRAQIASAELRRDMNAQFGRLGGKSVDGSYNAEATAGGVTDLMAEAILRTTWSAALVLSNAVGTAGAMTITASGSNFVLTRTGGSWITDGLRLGDIVVQTANATTATNNINLRVVAITALALTVAAPATSGFTTAGSAATWTLTRLKKAVSGAAPTRYSHTIEEYDTDVDLSQLFLGCRLTGFNISCKPGQVASIQYTFMGMDRTRLVNGTSPWYSSPTLTTGLSLIADDSAIYQDGVAVTTFTGFDLSFTIAATGVPVIGSFISPDIFDNILTVTGTITGFRSDFTALSQWDAETTFTLGLMLAEPGALPQACFGIYLPYVKFGDVQAPTLGTTGAKIETRALMVGTQIANAATGIDGTIAAFHSTAP